ncbi:MULTISPECIES: ATP-binding protein [Actinosynnema]|uniref:ATP-binding protein n=1 Tax=Actinosynnema TaxID=40566 RepID=UPI0020A5FC46|nr:ATP-binding protein [Actinosynnema pretiosum]
MAGFVGRTAELRLLSKRLDRVSGSGEGAAVAVRGRRQVGKSRLVQEFCDRADVPYFYFAATKGASPVESVTGFLAELADSSLAAAADVSPPSGVTGGWADAFRVLASALPERPSIVVLDEVPWLAEQDEVFGGALQTAWDRLWSRRPVLLVLLGSDLHMMERLTAYDRPFYGRADNLVLGPLNPAEVGTALGLEAAEAIDAHLVTGGLPGIVRSWAHAVPPAEFLRQECEDPAAPLFSVPESALMAEFPAPDQARRVVEAIGGDSRTHANIAAAAGSSHGQVPSGTLSPLLRKLAEEKRVLAVDHPLSTVAGKPALHRVADSNLRFYLSIGRAVQEQARRGRPQTGRRVLERQWTTWRGRAVEPLVREALEIAGQAGELPWPETAVVGGWWNRQHNPEIDLVGADRTPVAGRIDFAGSVKWIGTPFDRHDLTALRRGALEIPGYEAGRCGLAVVSLSGEDLGGEEVDLLWGAGDVMNCWNAL